jgi:hypothetical protein
MDIKLLAASVDTPRTSELNAEYTSLVPSGSRALDTRRSTQKDTAYPDDNFVWSASAGSDGTFNFFAVPPGNSGSGNASGSGNNIPSWQVSGSDWYANNAVFQYALHASMPTPMNGQLINLYA